jgi:hypothetical protein
MTACTRVPFDKPDGEDIHNNLALLAFVEFYAKIDNADICYIDPAKMERLFGAGELRPAEHTALVTVWRFKHDDTFLRVEIPTPNSHMKSSVTVEAPEGINESQGDDAIRANVAEFMATLKTSLTQA